MSHKGKHHLHEAMRAKSVNKIDTAKGAPAKLKAFLENEVEDFQSLREQAASKTKEALLLEMDQLISDRKNDIADIVSAITD
jgi:hypothetical protein